MIGNILDCLFDSRISIDNVDYGRCGINGIDLWQEEKNLGDYYKKGLGFCFFYITFESFHTYEFFFLSRSFVSSLEVLER